MTSSEHYEKAYYWAFVSAILLCWSPSNLLAYLAPLIALAIFVFVSRSHTVLRNAIIWFLCWGIIISVYVTLTPGFLIHSALLSVLTYSSFLVILAIPNRFVAGLGLLEQMLNWARWVVIVEALVGIVQGMYGLTRTGSLDRANGDYVEGTIHLALAPELALSNPMFAINMALLLTALLPELILRRKGYVAILLGGAALILASVLHVILMLAVASAIAILLYWPVTFRRRMTYLVMGGLIVAAIFSFSALRGNFGTANTFARQLLSGESYRTKAVRRAVVEMPEEYPFFPLIGLGPGQFSSRAGLIGTGLYFGGPVYPRPLPFLPQGMTEAFEKNTYDLWLEYSRLIARGVGSGSTHQPFLSWLSVYVEWGILAFVSVLVITAFLLVRVRLVVHSYPQRILATSFGTGSLLILFLGLQENYWEVPQAILVGLMILKVQYAVLIQPEPRSQLA